MSRQIFIIRVECPTKAIVHVINEPPAFPTSVTDTLGNTYTRQSETRETAVWYTCDGLAAESTWVTMTFPGGASDRFFLE